MYDMYHCDKRTIAIVNGSTTSILIRGVGWNSQSYIEICTCSLCCQPCTVAESCLSGVPQCNVSQSHRLLALYGKRCLVHRAR